MIHPQTFYIETYGCTFNQADSTKIANVLLDENYLPSSKDHAEIIIINTCAVKSQTEAKILHRLNTISLHPEQKLLITGCLPWISKSLLSQLTIINPRVQIIFDCNSLEDLAKILKSRQFKEVQILKSSKSIKKSKISSLTKDPNKPGILQISEGCSNSCSYCCTHFSRGKVLNYPVEDIINQIEVFLDHGIKEIYLTGQDCGEYVWNSYSVVDLARMIDDKFNQNEVFIRMGMLHPKHHHKIIELAEVFRNSSIFYKFLHIPIQSASNKVLSLMRRGYSKENISELFNEIQRNKITLSTDVICGFPEETDKDFKETFDFIEKYQPDILNISKYTSRPGTTSKSMKQVDSTIIKKRTQLLTKLHLNYIAEKNLRWNGWEGRVLIRNYQQNKKFQYSGRTEFYKPIVFQEGKRNNIMNASVISSTPHFLVGNILGEYEFLKN